MNEENLAQEEVLTEEVEQSEEVTDELEGGEETTEVEEQVEEPEKPEVSPGVQKRIDQLTRKRYEEQRRAEQAEQELQQMRERLEKLEQPKAPATRPTLEQFDFDAEQYATALAQYERSQAIADYQKRQQEEAARTQQQQEQVEFQTRREQTIAKGMTEYTDFEEVVLRNPEVVITPEMANIVTDSETGHAVAYYLGKNPSESQRIANLNPLAQARELGKIEAGLTQPPPKKPSNAPPPVTPVGSRGSQPPIVKPTLDNGEVNPEWVRLRNEGKI